MGGAASRRNKSIPVKQPPVWNEYELYQNKIEELICEKTAVESSLHELYQTIEQLYFNSETKQTTEVGDLGQQKIMAEIYLRNIVIEREAILKKLNDLSVKNGELLREIGKIRKDHEEDTRRLKVDMLGMQQELYSSRSCQDMHSNKLDEVQNYNKFLEKRNIELKRQFSTRSALK